MTYEQDEALCSHKILCYDFPTECRKVAADIYIDDKANGGNIEWEKIKERLNTLMKGNPLYNGYLTNH